MLYEGSYIGSFDSQTSFEHIYIYIFILYVHIVHMCAVSSKKVPWVYILFAFFAQHTYDNLNVI